MKLVRRRTPDPATTPPGGADGDRPAQAPPRGAMAAVYPEILDGVHLWVAVEDHPGTLALRSTGSGDVVVPSTHGARPDDQPGYLSAVLPLDEVTPETSFDVVLLAAGGRTPQPVWTPRPGRHVTAPDGRSRLLLDRAEDGAIRVRREPLAESVLLEEVSAEPDALVLRVDATGDRADVDVALLGEDGDAVATVGSVGSIIRLTTGAVAGLTAQQVRVTARGPVGWLPVRRRGNDLAEPGRGAPLPELRDPETGLPRLRLRWDADGLLTARILDGEDDA